MQDLSEVLKELNLETDREHCKGPIAEIPRAEVKPKVISTRNIKSGKGHIANVPIPRDQTSIHAHSSSQSIKVVEALRDQVQSLHDTVSVLEQRMTVLEEALGK